jgi:3',5'-cyclic AMP phosphodiesterase CpdA
MKIVHLTDLHVQTAPRAADLLGKRLISTANLYLLCRRSKFSRVVQEAAVVTTVAERPDVVVITGDLTAQALDAEFAEARQLLDPVLSAFPTVMISGNHDTYVSEAYPGARMREVFHPWMGAATPHLHRFGDVAFLTLETCRAHPLSSGYTAPTQLEAASALLAEAAGAFTFLCIHYPLRGRRGEPYGPWTRALSNAADVERWVASTDRLGAILHGHEHHGFRATLPSGGGDIPILDPGATGYAPDPARDRTAHLNVYEVDGQGISDVRRLRFAEGRFEPEPGGAYATGR